ncbi:MAG: hypothetical protein FJX66_06765 [Alphaproteobacteria bacterium]|nr:hypothetical protein [Alphaproteobacteria bacterium]
MLHQVSHRSALDDVEPVLSFLGASSDPTSPQETLAEVGRAITALGLKHFVLRTDIHRTHGHTQVSSVSNQPEAWNRRVVEAGYYEISAVFRISRKRRAPFNWFDILHDPETTEAQWRIHQEAQEFGVGPGLVVPIHPIGRPMSIFIAGSNPDDDPSADVIRDRRRAVHLLGLGVYESVAPFVREHRLIRDEASVCGEGANDNEASSEPPLWSTRPLTRFERDFLAWTAVGLDPWTISERCGWPLSQVERALAQAAKTLQVDSRAHAVVRAIQLHLVKP